MANKHTNIFSLTKQKETHRLKKQTWFVGYGCQEEGIVKDSGKIMYTLLYLKWIMKTYCTAQGTLVNVMCQPGWEGVLRENGYTYMYS